MKITIKRNKSCIDLLVEKNRENFLVMRIDNNVGGVGWEIYDFRYSTYPQPTSRPAINDLQYFKITPEARKYQNELFALPVKEENGHWIWYLNDGTVLEGCDYPLEQQIKRNKNSKLNHQLSELAVWKYKTALEKMKEAKVFWKNFEGDWGQTKVKNKYLNPPGDIAIKYTLKSLIERDSHK